MKNLKAIGLWSLIGAVVACGWLAVFNPTLPVSFSETQANEAVSAALPKQDRLLGLSYSLEAADIRFLENGRVQIDGYVIIGGKYAGDLSLEAEIVYRDGGFYAHEPVIRSVELENLDPSQTDEDLATLGKGLLDRAGGFFGKDDPEAGAAWGRLGTKLQERIVAGVKSFYVSTLASTPFYTLDSGDFKQNVARMALQSVDVSDNRLTVKLTARTFLLTLLMWAIALAASVALVGAAIYAGPGTFIALLTFGSLGG